MSQQAWQEDGGKENDNIPNPDDACWAFCSPNFGKKLALEYRLSIGRALAVEVCRFVRVTDVGLSHK